MKAPQRARLLLVLWVALGSAVGSLAAVVAVGGFAGRQIEVPWIVNTIALALAALCVMAVVMIFSDQPSTAATDPAYVTPQQPRDLGRVPDQPEPARVSPPSRTETPAEPTRFTLTGGPTTGPATGGLAWHEAAALGVAGASTPSAPAPPPLDPGPTPTSDPATSGRTGPPESSEIPLTSTPPVQVVRRIVQCPRCGSFGVRAERVREGCTFECDDCGHPWYWRPGTPWPQTVIRPRLRRPGQHPASAPPAVWHLPS